MTTSRAFSALCCGALVLGFAPPATAQPVVAKPAPSVKKAAREYGDGPVTMDSRRQGLRLTFHGKRGDLVGLFAKGYFWVSGDVTVTGATKLNERFRLTRSGKHVLQFTPDKKHWGKKLQLVKLHKRSITTGAKAVQLPPKRVGHAYLVGWRVPKTGASVAIKGDKASLDGALIGRSGRRMLYNPVMHNDPGNALYTGYWDMQYDAPALPAGRKALILTKGGGLIGAFRDRTINTTFDAPGTVVTYDDTNYGQAISLRFTSQGNQWLRPEIHTSTFDVTKVRVKSPGKNGRPGTRYAGPTPFDTLWWLQNTGPVTVTFFPSRNAWGKSVSIKASGLTVLEPLALGETRHVTDTIPGRGVLVPAPYGYAHARNANLWEDWSIVGARTSRTPCGPGDPLGCGEGDITTLSAAAPDTSNYIPWSGGFLYVPFAPGRSGSVDVSVTEQRTAGYR